MAQIKLLKINSDGWQEEHGSADDASFATVTGATQIGVTSGVTLTTNVAFNAVTDTIAGIENQNLVDKTATEAISGAWTINTGYALTLTDAPVANTDAANKAYVDSVANGVDWQESVIDQDLSTPPVSPSTGDRYIVGDTATDDWLGHENDVTEWNGTAWLFFTPTEGFAAWIEDENVVYVWNGSAWVKMSSVYSHNDLASLQGGTTSEYYHMTSAEDTWIGAGLTAVPTASNLVDKSTAQSISGAWSFSGAVDIGSGEFTFPTAASATPAEGDSYWDGTNDNLMIYDGSGWIDVGASGSADSIVVNYVAGTGGIAQFDAVYISAADTVLKANATALSTAKAIGFAPTAITATETGAIVTNGIIVGILTGATAGDVYFLDATAGLIATTRPSGSGNAVVKVGYAKNATDLQVDMNFVGVRS